MRRLLTHIVVSGLLAYRRASVRRKKRPALHYVPAPLCHTYAAN